MPDSSPNDQPHKGKYPWCPAQRQALVDAEKISVRWMDGWVDGWMDGWMDGWVSGYMGVWVGG